MPARTNAFIGREQELAQLQPFLSKKTASLLVIRGRRRVGKSRLAEEFAKKHTFYKFSGLAPVSGVTAQHQRDEFSRQLNEQLQTPSLNTGDWGELFTLLAKLTQKGRTVILFDEISWMAHADDTFLSKLKNAWEDHFKKNHELILILCGSISSWIEKNIISSTGYFGRISWNMQLQSLPLKDCALMLKSQGFKTTSHEMFKLLCVTGGIPWYIEQMQADFSVDDNIQRQCFTPAGVLFNDFDLIFHELFMKRDEIYKKIVAALASGPLDYAAIAKAIHYPNSGRLTEYLTDLNKAGFISKDETWSLKSQKPLDLYHYRLSDNYLRFYLKYIEPKKIQIGRQHVSDFSFQRAAGWEAIMGLQFENLVVNNRQELCQHLNLRPDNIVYDNPYFQRPTKRQQGCQIDFLIQTNINTLYVVEIKFSKKAIGRACIDEMKEKIARMTVPKNMVCIPVLVHVNGVSDNLLAEGYFQHIIDFSTLIKN